MNRIKELRKARGWLQDDLADKLKVSRQAVGHYETGTRGLDEETIVHCCKIFGVSADYLLGRSEQPGSLIADDEWLLLTAFRSADEDTQAMVRLALKRFLPAEKEKDAASL